jgi:hypothetical protein
MHAWIDGEAYGGQSIDVALRAMLGQFRLPGEAQKIDRIMEKFAEVGAAWGQQGPERGRGSPGLGAAGAPCGSLDHSA